ncbi:MAG: AAA family ATPase [Candidatus Brocadiae bacterium]|nr:AAA family ATPase [Candidatus Brocadiia bacterium]
MNVKTYSTKEFAKIVGISKNHLLKLELEGKVPAAKRVQRGKIEHRFYTVEDIVVYREILGMPPIIDKRRTQLFLNFKGGTGKSTISASYAYAVAELGIETLAIDLDAQQHMTKCLGFEAKRDTNSIYEVLIDNKDINEVIAHTKMPTLDIIPANIKLSVIENRLPNKEMKEFLLTSALNKIKLKDYKIIVIDSLPNITLLNKNAILCATDLLIPVLPDFFSFDGLGLLFEELARMESAFSLYTEFRGGLLDNIYVFINQYRSNEVMSRQSRGALEKNYADYLCETMIAYNTKIAQSTAAGMPIFQYNRSCTGAKHIKALVDEILKISQNRKKKVKKIQK